MNLRRRLGRQPIAVLWMSMGSTAIVELAANANADAVVIDMQHGLWDRMSLEQAVGTLPSGISALIRVADNSPVSIGQALDTGAEGVIVPMIETDGEAALAVAAARFPPHGRRSGGGVRPIAGGFANYAATANERTVVGVMIETERGVYNASAIARTPGVDFVLIGTGDLSLSLSAGGDRVITSQDACNAVLQACRNAGKPCAIFTTSADQAAARAKEGYAMVVAANDIGVVSQGFTESVDRFQNASRPNAPAASAGASSGPLLMQLASAIAGNKIRIVDLSQTLRPSTPVIQLPPEFAPSNPFTISEISHYDSRGPAWYWNNLSMGEHTGTHFDAPVHWVTGQHYADGYTDTIPVQRFIAPACVIDCTAEVAANEKFTLEPSHIEAWEVRHGRIPDGAWVLMRTGWSTRGDSPAFLNMKEDGPNSPGPSAAAITFLVQQRDVNGWGVEAVGTDHGQAFAFEPAFPAHHLMHGAKKFGLASLCNLDQLPPTGALLITPPLKIEKGSGSPLRVLALVAG
jgi:kynurenine formamidase/2-keto-3-deoxy-L-rhamnonate aldolase RhmA